MPICWAYVMLHHNVICTLFCRLFCKRWRVVAVWGRRSMLAGWAAPQAGQQHSPHRGRLTLWNVLLLLAIESAVLRTSCWHQYKLVAHVVVGLLHCCTELHQVFCCRLMPPSLASVTCSAESQQIAAVISPLIACCHQQHCQISVTQREWLLRQKTTIA